MLRKIAALTSPPIDYSMWDYVSLTNWDGAAATFSVPVTDATKEHLMVVINYATANGTTTTTDSVSIDRPTVNAVGGTASDYWDAWSEDNTGDEGTGTYMRIYRLTSGTQSVTVTAQTVEDYYGTLALLFKNNGKTEIAAVRKPTTTTVAQTTINVEISNLNVGDYFTHAGGTLSLTESGVNEIFISGFEKKSSAMIVFTHGYGTTDDFNLNEFAKLTRNGSLDPATPVASFSNVGSSLSSWIEVRVYDGLDIRSNGQLRVETNKNYGQGDAILVLVI